MASEEVRVHIEVTEGELDTLIEALRKLSLRDNSHAWVLYKRFQSTKRRLVR